MTEARTTTAPRGATHPGTRARNERLILSLIRRQGPLPKAEIARQIGLSAQSVSVIIKTLEADGLLCREKPQRGRIGQPSVPMALAAQGAYFLGLSVGRRRLELVLVDFLGQIVDRREQPVSTPCPDTVLAFARSAMDELTTPLPQERIAGLGIALPGHLWDWPEATGATDWRRRDLAAELRDLPYPVHMLNDASAACGAELVFGTADLPADFLYVFVGHFIGGGLVLDGCLQTGRRGNAAALGSMPVGSPGGPFTQLIDVASLATLERLLSPHDASIPTTPDHWNLPHKPLDLWLDGAATGLAQAVASATCVVDVDCVVLDGWLPEDLRADLVNRTQAQLDARPLPGIETPRLRPGTIGPDARTLGAASLPLTHRFLVDRTVYPGG